VEPEDPVPVEPEDPVPVKPEAPGDALAAELPLAVDEPPPPNSDRIELTVLCSCDDGVEVVPALPARVDTAAPLVVPVPVVVVVAEPVVVAVPVVVIAVVVVGALAKLEDEVWLARSATVNFDALVVGPV
jgi:hypothetical protein